MDNNDIPPLPKGATYGAPSDIPPLPKGASYGAPKDASFSEKKQPSSGKESVRIGKYSIPTTPSSERFVSEFGKTFHPAKAITEEGIIPQAYQYAKRQFTGEPAPKAEEKPEKPVSFIKSATDMVKFAKSNPGAFAGTLANAIVADPELLFMPDLIPARFVAATEKVSKGAGAVLKTADAATQAAAMAAAQSAARQLNERGKVDMKVLRQEAQNAAILSGGIRAVGEVGRGILPGEKYLNEATKRMVDEARAKGYRLPAGQLSPLGAIIDKYYQSPIRSINKEKFYKEVTAPTGTSVSEINPTTLPKIDNNLGKEVEEIMSGHSLASPPEFSDEIGKYLTDTRGKINNILQDVKQGVPISGHDWHDIRSELGRIKNLNMKSSNHVVAEDIDNIMSHWDAIAERQLPSDDLARFNTWKGKYAAYKDIEKAALQGEGYKRYLKGELDPKDIMNSIRSRRPSETLSPFEEGTRPQTSTTALAEGLDLMGETKAVPWTWFNTAPKAAAGVVAKPLQSLAYTPLAQSIMYHGMPEFGVAPKIGGYYQDTINKRRKP